MIFKYKLVATGGTFDRFHKGHQTLLCRAFTVGEKVIIGVTSDNWVQKQHKILKEIVLPYEKRVEEIQKFLQKKGFLGREIIEKLENIYGPTVVNGKVEALVCTRETRKGVSLINKLRQKERKRKLAVVECSFITSSDHYHISSTRIRLGEINRSGDILLRSAYGHTLPNSLRESLSHPIDKLYVNVRELIGDINRPVILISCGDVVYQELIRQGISPNISVIDLKIGRKNLALYQTISSLASQGPTLQGYRGGFDYFDYVVKNKAGTISPSLIRVLKKAVKQYLLTKKSLVIRVIGEEDLAVIPAILVSPLETVILYGQPPISSIKGGPARNAESIPASNVSCSDTGWASAGGVVRVIVTEEKKRWAVELLRKFQ